MYTPEKEVSIRITNVDLRVSRERITFEGGRIENEFDALKLEALLASWRKSRHERMLDKLAADLIDLEGEDDSQA